MVVPDSRIKIDLAAFDSRAAGYMDAMHGLCIECHKEVSNTMFAREDSLSNCTHCHRSLPHIEGEPWARGL